MAMHLAGSVKQRYGPGAESSCRCLPRSSMAMRAGEQGLRRHAGHTASVLPRFVQFGVHEGRHSIAAAAPASAQATPARQCGISGDDHSSAGERTARPREIKDGCTRHAHVYYTYLPARGVCRRARRSPRRHCACPTPKQAQAQQGSPPLPRSCSTLGPLRIAHNDGRVSGTVVAAAIQHLHRVRQHARRHRPLRISPHTTPAGTAQVRGVQSSSRWLPVTTRDTCDRTRPRPVCGDAYAACEDGTQVNAPPPTLCTTACGSPCCQRRCHRACPSPMHGKRCRCRYARRSSTLSNPPSPVDARRTPTATEPGTRPTPADRAS